jgi:hypothetical protein
MAIIRHPAKSTNGMAIEVSAASLTASRHSPERGGAMTMMYTLSAAIDPIFISTPSRAVKLRRSAADLRCAATMLEKLRCGEDFVGQTDEADRVIDAVVDRILGEDAA